MSLKLPAEGLSYAAAGVNIEAYAKMLEAMRPAIEATHGKGVASGVGPFAGLFELPGGSYLAASADGVGTKIKVAIAAGSHRGIGQDLVNHCVNDIATAGAKPLFMLDYFATGRLEEEVFSAVVGGITDACRATSCALLGGETAELPGMYALGDYDLAGFIVGLVEPNQAPDITKVSAGDILMGIPSSGLHTNGYSLVRQVFEDVPMSHVFPELGAPLGQVLLEPHRCYLAELQRLRPFWKGAAHITGGGLRDNLPRVIPDGLSARVDLGSWEVPPLFRLIADRGDVSRDEMFGTFNMGLGMILVVAQGDVAKVAEHGFFAIGEVEADSRPDRIRFIP
ncbi:MAG TPA: phosphoribosylformylglycinamidine cyclo-ligase [Candidatus Dormibacteraeota bacterium]|jgi:phosphoribosylformylglycinamidine cyclo-ligase|nr:phosphoribosylformylglycinamidine cyclo-ligase [Candidatus Dormibacteraeota bacterium]